MNPDPACRPEFFESGNAVLEPKSLRHPCVIPGIASEFIPNDIVLGGQSPYVILVTGPNMGGKSTLLLQVTKKKKVPWLPNRRARVVREKSCSFFC